MEGKYLIAIAFLASWTVIIASKLPDIFEEQCPPGTPCPPVLISHQDCNKFYECQNGQKVTITCEAGLYFSKYWRGCVDRQSSDCPVTPTPTPDPTPDPDQCRHDGDRIKHECRCEKFYECINGRKALRDCPADHHFDPSISDCVPGPCETTIPPPTNTTLPPTTTTSQPYCREGELIPHECKCTKYYLCKGGRKALRDCPPGKHFDNVTRSGCIDGEKCDPLICLDGDRMKHDCNCTQYYECSNNDWYPQYCKDDQHFNNKTKTCMAKEIAGCDPKIKPPGYCEPENPPLNNHECDCRLYYKCENNVKKLYSCDWGKYFDKVKQNCEILTNVNDCIKIIGRR